MRGGDGAIERSGFTQIFDNFYERGEICPILVDWSQCSLISTVRRGHLFVFYQFEEVYLSLQLVNMGCFPEKTKPAPQQPAPSPPIACLQRMVETIKRDSLLKDIPNNDDLIRDLTKTALDRTTPQFSTNCVLLFRGSEHHFKAASFHELCNGKRNTVLLVKTDKDAILGGFTPCEWKKDEMYDYVPDPRCLSFLFRTEEKGVKYYQLDPESKEQAIMNDDHCGPVFGAGHDLIISDDSNEHRSWANMGKSYGCPFPYGSKKANQLLAGEQNFKVKEYEVWEIVNS